MYVSMGVHLILQASEKLGEQRIYSYIKYNCLVFSHMNISCRGEAPLKGFAQVHDSNKIVFLINIHLSWDFKKRNLTKHERLLKYMYN